MREKFVIALAILCGLVYFADAKTERVICYYGSWANYRHGNGKYTAEDIDAGLCTHVIYTFLGIQNDGNLEILDKYLEIDLHNWARFNALKTKNPKLKTLIAVGGWNQGSIKYSAVAADPAKRATLIKSAVSILETYGFDGFDIDWEYPGQRGGAWSDKANYATLLREFREEFDKKGFILTAAVAAAAGSVDLSYDVPALSKYLDSINVMAYDLHGAYDGVTGANAPLYPSSVDLTPNAKALTVDASIRGWIARGADPQKISMGMPLYGRSFTLSDPNSRSIGAPASNAGSPGPYTKEGGMLGYLEICELQKQGGWTEVWDDNTKTPFTYKGNQWVGYDNEKSIRHKVEYAKSLNLGGVMLWSLETADFKGICGNKYPILTAIKNMLNDGSGNDDNNEPLPEPAPLPPKPEPNPQPDDSDKKPDSEDNESNESDNESKESDKNSKESDKNSNESDENSNESKDNSDSDDSSNDSGAKGTLCKEVGLVRDPKDCSTFYSCVPIYLTLQPVKFVCSNGLAFDAKANACNYKELVDC